MAYIENVVIGTPIVDPKDMFASDEDDWQGWKRRKLIIQKKDSFQKFLWN